MIKVTTESGATYLVDDENKRVNRLSGPYSPGINYDLVADDNWHGFSDRSEAVLGRSLELILTSGLYRVTTHVVGVETVDS